MSERTRGTPRTIAAWVRRSVATDGEVTLSSEGAGSTDPILRWQAAVDADVLAEEALDAAQADCDAREVRASYRLRAADADGAQLASYLMRCRPQSSAEGPLEGPEMAGIVAQQMRHQEALARLLVQSLGSITASMTRLLDAEAARAERATAQAAEALGAESEIASLERELLDQQRKGARADQLWAMAIQHGGPAILKALTSPASPASPDSTSGGKP